MRGETRFAILNCSDSDPAKSFRFFRIRIQIRIRNMDPAKSFGFFRIRIWIRNTDERGSSLRFTTGTLCGFDFGSSKKFWILSDSDSDKAVLRIRDPVPFYPKDPGSGSGMIIFRIPDLGSRILTTS
jgi:hypothetical protein